MTEGSVTRRALPSLDRVWNDFPELVPGVLAADSINADVAVASRVDAFVAVAASRLEKQSEGELLPRDPGMASRLLEDGAQADPVSLRLGGALAALEKGGFGLSPERR
jgi:hypothetical protein